MTNSAILVGYAVAAQPLDVSVRRRLLAGTVPAVAVADLGLMHFALDGLTSVLVPLRPVLAARTGALLAAHQAGRVQVAIGRASDYFGPRGGAQSNLGDRVCPPALAGRTATVLGDPDQPHTYTYIPDIGEGLAVLGEHPEAPGQVWHLPNDPDTKTTRQLVDIDYQHAGRPRVKLRAMPPLLLRALGVYSKLATKLGVQATPIGRALADTLAGYRHG